MTFAARTSFPVVSATAFAMLLISFQAASADVVELKSGQKVEGTFKSADDTAVKIEIGGQVVTFKPEEVRAIYYGSAPLALAPAPPSAASTAIRALKALQSVTSAGITYRDYGPRLADTKIEVDRHLGNGPHEDGAIVEAIRETMDLYAFAGRAWAAKVSASPDAYVDIAGEAIAKRCPLLQRLLADMPPRAGLSVRDEKMDRGVAISLAVPFIWSCASDKLAEAEKLVGGRASRPQTPTVPSPSSSGPPLATRCPTTAEEVDGVITKVDLNEGKLTLRDAEGKTYQFSASKEALQANKVGDRLQIRKRLPPGC